MLSAVPFIGQHQEYPGVHVGAIVTVPGRVQLRNRTAEEGLNSSSSSIPPIAQWDLLGKSVLDRTIERLQAFGVGEICIIPEQSLDPTPAPPLNAFWTSWEAAISRCLTFDLETLLLFRVGPYVELDVPDFLRFHRETSSAMTQAYDKRGALDLVAIDGRRLATGTGSFRARLRDLIPAHQRYHFSGYSNRLSSASDFRALVRDALVGVAGVRAIGTEVSTNIWVGKDARIDSSARIAAPAYIGKNTRVNAACVIGGASSIEQQSQIDCGTTVHDSCVLPSTYIGPGLKVCGTIVYQETLFHLGRNLELQFHDHKLFGKTFSGKALLPRMRPTGAARPQLLTY